MRALAAALCEGVGGGGSGVHSSVSHESGAVGELGDPRLVGEAIYLGGGVGLRADPGMYALIGAAGMLGGACPKEEETNCLSIFVLEMILSPMAP